MADVDVGGTVQAVHPISGQWEKAKVVARDVTEGTGVTVTAVKFRHRKFTQNIERKYIRKPVPHIEVTERGKDHNINFDLSINCHVELFAAVSGLSRSRQATPYSPIKLISSTTSLYVIQRNGL